MIEYYPQKHYFSAVFLISIVLLGCFTLVLYRQWEAYNLSNLWVTHSYEVMRDGRKLLIAADDVENGQRGYLLTHSPVFLNPAAEAEAAQVLTRLKGTVNDNATEQRRIDEIGRDLAAVLHILNEHTRRFEQGAVLNAQDLAQTQAATNKLREDVGDFLSDEDALLHQRTARANDEQRLYVFTLFAGALVAVGGVTLANLLVWALVTRNRRAQAIFHAFEEGHRMVLEGVSDGIFDYDPQSGTVLYSPSYERLLGYTPPEMPGSIETFNRLLHPDDYASAWEALEQYFRRETPHYNSVFRLRHKDGSWRWILARGVASWDEQGGVRRMVGTHTDITEQKEKEEQLKHLNADLESFAYIASHDLRAPLVNLRGFAGELELALKEALPLVDKAAAALKPKEQETIQTAFQKDIPESLGFIHTAVDKMDMLTTAILDLSRIGRREYRDELVDTTAVVKRCLDTLAYEIQTKKIQVTCEDLPPLLIDPLALEQIFSNILDNAVKYLDPSRPGMIRIQAKQLPGAVEFSIEDNGKGIAIVDRHKVFDIFRRAGNSSNVRGIGIGMAFVKTTLRRLGGKIWFESAPGMGATFCFTIPQHSHN